TPRKTPAPAGCRSSPVSWRPRGGLLQRLRVLAELPVADPATEAVELVLLHRGERVDERRAERLLQRLVGRERGQRVGERRRQRRSLLLLGEAVDEAGERGRRLELPLDPVEPRGQRGRVCEVRVRRPVADADLDSRRTAALARD